jgi:hypothetical protein
MKYIILTIVTLFAFASCSKSDEVPPSIIGKWEFISEFRYNSDFIPEPDQPYQRNSNGCEKNFISFDDKNNYTYRQNSFDNVNNKCTSQEIKIFYLKDGSNLIVTEPFRETYNIKTLTATDLIIEQKFQLDSKPFVGFKLRRIQ